MIQVDKSGQTRAWCRKNFFSGVRSDPILRNAEIWIMGTIAKEVSEVAISINPNAITEAYAEVFCLSPDNVELL